MGTNALESFNLVESEGALHNIDAPRPVYMLSRLGNVPSQNLSQLSHDEIFHPLQYKQVSCLIYIGQDIAASIVITANCKYLTMVCSFYVDVCENDIKGRAVVLHCLLVKKGAGYDSLYFMS